MILTGATVTTAHNRRNGRANGYGAHDRRSFYRVPAGGEVVAVQIPDPYGVSSDAEAQRAPGLRSEGTEAPGEEWRAPSRAPQEDKPVPGDETQPRRRSYRREWLRERKRQPGTK